MPTSIPRIARSYYLHDMKLMTHHEMEKFQFKTKIKESEMTPALATKIGELESLLRQFKNSDKKLLNYFWCQKSFTLSLSLKKALDKWYTDNTATLPTDAQTHITALNGRYAAEVTTKLWIDTTGPWKTTPIAGGVTPAVKATYTIKFNSGTDYTLAGAPLNVPVTEAVAGAGSALSTITFPTVTVTNATKKHKTATWVCTGAILGEKTEAEIKATTVKGNVFVSPVLIAK